MRRMEKVALVLLGCEVELSLEAVEAVRRRKGPSTLIGAHAS